MKTPVETYVVESPTNSSRPIVLDGTYFTFEYQRLLEKFRSQPNPESRVRKIADNARNIFEKVQRLEDEKCPRNLLLVGKVQSGKTSNMQMAMALAFDNGYDAAILFGGYDKALLDQAVTRFSEDAFPKPAGMSDDDAFSKWVNIFRDRPGGKNPMMDTLDDATIDEIVSNGGKLLFICLKKAGSIDKAASISRILSRHHIKALIFDDEGDQAGLNTVFRKKEMSSTYRAIYDLKKALKNPPYISVTATPEALVFSPQMSELKPADLCLLKPGLGYTGLSAFHLGNSKRVVVINDELDSYFDDKKSVLPNTLSVALYHYFISSALLRHRNKLSKTQMIIHTDKRVEFHKFVVDLLSRYANGFKENLEYGQESTFKNKLSLLEHVWENEAIFDSDLKGDVKFEDIIPDIKEVIRGLHIIEMNQHGNREGALRYKYKIYVGADLLQRGVSFDQLVTTYFTRIPKTKGNMDTQTQRARWLGYRSGYLDYCKVFTTQAISSQFSNLAEIEDDLWTQLSDVERGIKTLDEIMVNAEPTLRPSRRNVSTFEVKTFGRKWFSQKYLVDSRETANQNNATLANFILGRSFSEISSGAGPKDASRKTGFLTSITYAEFENLISKLEDVFNNKPFDGVKNILKSVSSRERINLITFFDPKSIDSDRLSAASEFDKRNRSAYETEEGKMQISALMQGADNIDASQARYLGDAYVLPDPSVLTIHVYSIFPVCDMNVNPFRSIPQYMFAIHFPKPVAVYERGDE